MRFGVNMFGMSELCRENPEQFFAHVSSLGYGQIEPCIALSELGGFEHVIWKVSDFEAYYERLVHYGLEPVSCHIFSNDFQKEIPTLEKLVKKYGVKQFVIGCPREINREIYEKFAEKAIALAESLTSFGAELLLHNNPQEIETQIDGISAYEWLLKACHGTVGAQADAGWLLFGGKDPEAFLWEHKAIIKSLHYKDIKGTSKDMDTDGSNICLGKGKVDAFACFQFARAMGIPQIMDQDTSDVGMLEDLAEGKKLLDSFTQRRDNTRSILNILDTKTGEVKKLAEYDKIIEAPNWLKDGDNLLYNSDGLIYRYHIPTGTVERIDTGFCDNCNNDHVLSPDHTQLAVSHSPQNSWMSKIYILPVTGGEPKLITPEGPSFLHGWSQDGSELAYCAFRNMSENSFDVDIYSIPATGGEEKRLTNGEGFNDGPEYAPNGKHIWFNSTRTGLMQIWRMDLDGSNPVQMTFEEKNNWFAHISPDGSKVINLAYRKGDLDPNEHLPNMQVELWLMNYDGTERNLVLSFFGGQGSINVNSWSPDNQYVAFVSYELPLGS